MKTAKIPSGCTIEIDDDREFLVKGLDNNRWAKHPSLDMARRACESPRVFVVYSVHPNSSVGELGDISYPTGSSGDRHEHAPVRLFRKG